MSSPRATWGPEPSPVPRKEPGRRAAGVNTLRSSRRKPETLRCILGVAVSAAALSLLNRRPAGGATCKASGSGEGVASEPLEISRARASRRLSPVRDSAPDSVPGRAARGRWVAWSPKAAEAADNAGLLRRRRREGPPGSPPAPTLVFPLPPAFPSGHFRQAQLYLAVLPWKTECSPLKASSFVLLAARPPMEANQERKDDSL